MTAPPNKPNVQRVKDQKDSPIYQKRGYAKLPENIEPMAPVAITNLKGTKYGWVKTVSDEDSIKYMENN